MRQLVVCFCSEYASASYIIGPTDISVGYSILVSFWL